MEHDIKEEGCIMDVEGVRLLAWSLKKRVSESQSGLYIYITLLSLYTSFENITGRVFRLASG